MNIIQNKKNVVFICILLFALDVVAEEYAYVPVQEGANLKSTYFRTLGYPYITIFEKCNKDKICVRKIKNHKNKTLKSFGNNDTISIRAEGRYKDKALALIRHSYPSGKEAITEYFLIDDQGQSRSYSFNINWFFVKAKIITHSGDLVIVKSDGIYLNDTLQVESPVKFETATIANHSEGAISGFALGVDNQFYQLDIDGIQETNLWVTDASDRLNIMAYYPVSKNKAYGVYYEYINSYNKGLKFFEWQRNKSISHNGWIFNSEDRNIGFDPQIYSDGKEIYVSADDSTNRNKVHFVLSPTNLDGITDTPPKHTEGYESPSNFDLLAGAELSYLNWLTSSTVEKNDVTFLEVEYDIGSSIYKGAFFQARIYNAQLAVSFLQNEAKKRGGLTAKTSKALNFVLDINGLFSKRSLLRLSTSKSNINGIANIKKDSPNKQEFESEFKKYSALVMWEKGIYGGFQYLNYKMPAAVGFSNSSQSIVSTIYDPAVNFKMYNVIIGYDELSYAKRYETNLKRLYLSLYSGVGIGSADLSSAIRNKIEAGGNKIKSTLTLNLLLNFDLGYIYQKRYKKAGGIGFMFAGGYRFNGLLFGAGQSDEDESTLEANELTLELTKWDIWHGPFIVASVLF